MKYNVYYPDGDYKCTVDTYEKAKTESIGFSKEDIREINTGNTMENEKAVGKFIIIKDLEFTDFMKGEDGKIMTFDTLDDACVTCGMYEFPNVLVCKIEFNHIEPEYNG